jgi:hypothetical protein
MKLNSPLFLVCLIAASHHLCSAQSLTTSATGYLASINQEFYKISQEVMSYVSASSHGKSPKKVEKQRLELLNQLKAAEKNIRKMRPFDNQSTLRDSVIEYLSISYSLFNEDYSKIIDMEEVAEQSYNQMEAYMLAKEMAGKKSDQALMRVNGQFESFAKKYNIQLSDNKSELSKKMETANKVMTHYNQTYLIFFKSYKDEAFLTESFRTNDIGLQEQKREALLLSSSEGLAKIGPLASFKNDQTLKFACQQLLNFYKDEAQTKVPVLIDFHLKKENFDKISKAFEDKKQEERTKKDIDNYNNAVKEINSALQKANLLSDELNKKRKQLLDNWNRVSDQFLHTHVPKYKG